MKTKLLAMLGMLAAHCAAAVLVYDNTADPTPAAYSFTASGALQIGDILTLGGTERQLESATVQFLNLGDAGTFSARLRFYAVGLGVGSQIGSTFLVTDLAIGPLGDATDTVNYTFSGLGLLVPTDLALLIEVFNASSGTEIALTAFSGPSLGASDGNSLFSFDGTNFSTPATSPGEGNLYLRLTAASDVPEPGTFGLMGIALGWTAWRMRRRAETRKP
ncbi:MAG: PEP-CTERM sorting domain-containing protein [Bryobacterales bacterium]|nr:PEP-CTERM sorting domain-containing protein [Bryobacterales bacterium]